MTNEDNFIPQVTADGSFTFISKEFGKFFHSHYGARQESFFKFASPTQLALKANKPVLRLLDVCYGLGYNTAAALQTIWAVNPNCYIAHHLFDNWSYEYTKILTSLASDHQVLRDNLGAKALIGDARNTIGQVSISLRFSGGCNFSRCFFTT
jgi:tRNA U34 5-methylaminomethyl-2-thiouridine-forming methyltransferase MnmC